MSRFPYGHMILNCKHIQIYVAFFNILLLTVHLNVLTHSVEHPFHAPDQSCQIFLPLEKSGNGLTFAISQLAPLIKNTLPSPRIVTFRLILLQTVYFARAPPLFFSKKP